MRQLRGRPALSTVLALSFSLLLAGVAPLGAAPPSSAATPIGVAQARATQDGSTATVRGYVVGQPISSGTVVTSGFPTDYALALADAPGETDTEDMLYVQIPSGFRADFGLASNPGRMGQLLDVTGTLTTYFSRPGLKNGSAFAVVDGGDDGGDGGGSDPGGDEPAGYYDAADGLTGNALKSALHGIIDDHAELSYSTVWTALRETDEDPNDSSNVIELYTGTSISKDDNGGNVGDWNREHTWAKSHGDFGTSAGPGTDLHHLRPSDVQVNSTRGNKDFDEGGSSVSGCGGCYTDADSFEPPDRVKGDVARMLFYMAVRYEGDDGVDLELNDAVSSGSAPWHGRISVLLDWHASDPVSATERRRNEIIYTDWQGNRNPFIDHPEWAGQIW
ncbi:endonuclease [Myceligenerans pegani]|uniref:Endonuclease n=1 Tax=Myceligenerans pegani TaxID=2776917 RepID=A0ABR9MXV8_9MICO|nr:endonuclease [Myceligenerans sp. TRM 65318]MBE1876211.1 endonuclease [Myceligenerans sp. TRM 65318]MBE3018482.1 endonuclease [Myceligenerans sp. TRM 65318]